MASGSTGAPGNIPYPVGSDQYALTSDLAGMASQINLGLANAGGPSDPRPPLTHGHAVDDVQDLRTILDGKAVVGHGHTIEQITGLSASLDAARWDRGIVNTSTADLDLATTPGAYVYPAWRNAANRPAGATGGIASVYPLTATAVTQVWLDDAGWAAKRSQRTTGAFGPWAREPSLAHDPLTTDDHLDTLTAPGFYPIPSTQVATAVGSPLPGPGGASVERSGYDGANGPILRETVWSYLDVSTRSRIRMSNGSWGPWDTGTARADIGSAVTHEARLSKWIAETPPVHTGGRGAIAFTFDHGLTKFEATGIPAQFASRGWGYGLALNSARLGDAENSGATVAEVLSWEGAEIWNHGRTHSTAVNPAQVRDEIVTGKTELESLFGREIFGYIPAGVGVDGLLGFDGGSSPEQFGTTLAGQLILEHHAVTTGYMGTGGVRQLTGKVQQGIGRFTMDAQTVSRIKLQIDTAINDRVGVMFMLHPALLDTTGYLTTAGLIEVLAYAKARQDAGALSVLSPGELVRADAGPAPDATDRLAALERTTGWRVITPASGTGGTIRIKRDGSAVKVLLSSFRPAATGGVDVITIPSGFRPLYTVPLWADENGTARPMYALAYSPHSLELRSIGTVGSYVHASGTWDTSDPWPASLPGSPA